MDEAQAGIKIARRNINNLRYADDTTLMVESEEELKSLLMKVREECEKAGSELNIQKTKIVAPGPIGLWQMKRSESHSVLSDSLQPHGLSSPWNSPGQNTGVGSLSLLQGIFPTQGLNPGLPHCRQILYQLSHKGSPRILEWVAYPFFRRSS